MMCCCLGALERWRVPGLGGSEERAPRARCAGVWSALEERRVPALWVWGAVERQKPQSRCAGVWGLRGSAAPEAGRD